MNNAGRCCLGQPHSTTDAPCAPARKACNQLFRYFINSITS